MTCYDLLRIDWLLTHICMHGATNACYMVSMCFPSPQLDLTLSELLSAEWRALHPGSRIVSRANGKGASKVCPSYCSPYMVLRYVNACMHEATKACYMVSTCFPSLQVKLTFSRNKYTVPLLLHTIVN